MNCSTFIGKIIDGNPIGFGNYYYVRNATPMAVRKQAVCLSCNMLTVHKDKVILSTNINMFVKENDADYHFVDFDDLSDAVSSTTSDIMLDFKSHNDGRVKWVNMHIK